ncbi:MAG: L-aspartate oxidase [Thermoanaerobaculia bacterium]|nr:L-aspartate oxidase [Thermoanaerobaculia bacterium]
MAGGVGAGGLVSLDASSLADQVRHTDAVVVGTGVAGLTAALGLTAPGRRVVLLTKTQPGDSPLRGKHFGGGSSPWAQGGVAVALSGEDSPSLHAEDTAEAGAGIADPSAIRVLTGEGPDQVRRLIELGTAFDRDAKGDLKFGREAAHRRRRVLHANGDATGAELVRSLVEAVHANRRIEIVENARATDLVLCRGAVVGLLVRQHDSADASTTLYRAPAVILATGGLGQLYLHTTNPRENTGDGLALAARAGAHLADLEFVQFHPTALDVKSDPLPLATEALRGEGALLVDETGRRFMAEIHPDAELAPRDVVSRGLFFARQNGHRTFLDAREAVGAAFPDRFPTVWQHCQDHGIDPRVEPIPVTPAAHYSMAGVVTDLWGRTSLDGLWACGEVTSTGVHGANRLASNSLLEALVWGDRVARDVGDRLQRPIRSIPGRLEVRHEALIPADDPSTRELLRRLMWAHVGVVRDDEGLDEASRRLDELLMSAQQADAPGELANLLTVARLVVTAARYRRESRGGHYRSDHPQSDVAWARRMAWVYKPGRPDGTCLEPVLDQLESSRTFSARRLAVMA